MNKHDDLEFVVCPKCSALGQNENGGPCGECNRIGIGIFKFGRFLYFNSDLRPVTIKAKRAKQILARGFESLLYLFGAGGCATLLIWFYRQSLDASKLSDFYFWQFQDNYLLIFWLGVLALLYGYFFHNIAQDRAMKKIIAKKFKNEPENWGELRTYSGAFKINAVSNLSHFSVNILEKAVLLAKKYNHRFISPIHFWIVATENKSILEILKRLDLDTDALRQGFDNLLQTEELAEKDVIADPILHPDLRRGIITAWARKYERGGKFVDVADILVFVGVYSEKIIAMLTMHGLDADDLLGVWEWLQIDHMASEKQARVRQAKKFKNDKGFWRFYRSVATPVLDHFSQDLSREARLESLEICLKRDDELRAVLSVMQKNGVAVLVGPDGIGKSVIVGEVARAIVDGRAFSLINKKRIVKLNMNKLAQNANIESINDRLAVILDEVKTAGNVILYLENIDDWDGLIKDSADIIFNGLRHAIQEDKLYLIITARQTDNLPSYFVDKFLVDIEQLDIKASLTVLSLKAGYLESRYNIYFTWQALKKIAQFCAKYMAGKSMPATAVSALDIVSVALSVKNASKKIIKDQDALKVIGNAQGVKTEDLMKYEQRVKLTIGLENKIKEDFFGQNDLISSLVAVIKKVTYNREQLSCPPFLVIGKENSGKETLLRALAKHYYGNEKNLIIIDCGSQDSLNIDRFSEILQDNQGDVIVYLKDFDKSAQEFQNHIFELWNNRIEASENIILTAGLSIADKDFYSDVITGVDYDKIVTVAKKLAYERLGIKVADMFKEVLPFSTVQFRDALDMVAARMQKIKKVFELQGIVFRVDEKVAEYLAKEYFDPISGLGALGQKLSDIEESAADKFLSGIINQGDILFLDGTGQLLITN